MRAASRDCGFTLTEAAVVIACLAALSAVVLMGRGFLSESRQDQTLTTVLNLHTAANLWSVRNNYGHGYAGGGLPNTLSLKEICKAGLIMPPGATEPDEANTKYVLTAWKTVFVVEPEDTLAVADGRIRYMRIKFCVPEETAAADLETKLTKTQRFDSVQRIPCSGGGFGIQVVGK